VYVGQGGNGGGGVEEIGAENCERQCCSGQVMIV